MSPNLRLLTALLFLLPITALPLLGQAKKDPPKQPAARNELDGLWMLEKQEENVPPGGGRWRAHWEQAIYLENGGYNFVTKTGFNMHDQPYSFTSDATKTPKTFDYKFGRDVWQGIYKIEGDTLTVATCFSPTKRPEVFSTKLEEGAGRAFHVRIYKKVVETAEEAKKREKVELDPKTQKLDGLWTFSDGESNPPRGGGYPLHWEEAVYIEGNLLHFASKNGKLKWEIPGKLKMDPSQNPPTIDMKLNKEGEWAGIYKIEGDKLTFGWVGRDEERPLWFTTALTAGKGRAYYTRTYDRVKETAEVTKLKQPLKLDPKTQVLDGLWILDDQGSIGGMAGAGSNLRIGDAIYLENGKWTSAKKNGTITKDTKATYTSDATTPVPIIDIRINRDVVYRGIYKIEGDTLTFATNWSDDERPKYLTTNLTCGAGRALYLATFTRAPKEQPK